jgi:hypothetical protein
MQDPWRIENEAQLRDVLGEAHPATFAKVADRLDEVARDFIAHSPLILVATSDDSGQMDVSPKGDAPGFVVMEDDRTLLIPERPGNRMALGFSNLLRHPAISLIFLLPGVRETLRVNGTAEITRDPDLLQRLAAQDKPALLVTRVRIEECFLHCGKALIRSRLWQPDHWGPAPDVSFGRQLRAKKVALPVTPEEVDASIEQDYVDRLY